MLAQIRKLLARTDWILLALCLAATIFGTVIISSATNYYGSGTYIMKQLVSLALGLIVYVILSFVDMEILAEHQMILTFAGVAFIALLIPFGEAGNTGNRAWISVPGLPFMIQPAEYCKIVYILVVARIMKIYQERINSMPCVSQIVLVSGLFIGLIVIISKDAGVALIYVFTFFIMSIAAGFSPLWYIAVGIAGVIIVPIVWTSGLVREDQIERVMMLFDSSIDPDGLDVRWQTMKSLNAIKGGGLGGQGLYHGTQTQAANIPEQHTDFIFAVIGEELGFIGCVLCIILLVAIVLRIIYVGNHTGSYFYRQICVGIAGMLTFQILINIGMCLGVMPVIGLTLPFISYGGSSLLSLYTAMGVISSIRMHPSPDTQERYISLPV